MGLMAGNPPAVPTDVKKLSKVTELGKTVCINLNQCINMPKILTSSAFSLLPALALKTAKMF